MHCLRLEARTVNSLPTYIFIGYDRIRLRPRILPQAALLLLIDSGTRRPLFLLHSAEAGHAHTSTFFTLYSTTSGTFFTHRCRRVLDLFLGLA